MVLDNVDSIFDWTNVSLHRICLMSRYWSCVVDQHGIPDALIRFTVCARGCVCVCVWVGGVGGGACLWAGGCMHVCVHISFGHEHVQAD